MQPALVVLEAGSLGRGVEGTQAPAQLQLVETSRPAEPVAVDEELPHRTKPRRRRGASAESEPLILVETQESVPAPGDNPTASPPQ